MFPAWIAQMIQLLDTRRLVWRRHCCRFRSYSRRCPGRCLCNCSCCHFCGWRCAWRSLCSCRDGFQGACFLLSWLLRGWFGCWKSGSGNLWSLRRAFSCACFCWWHRSRRCCSCSRLCCRSYSHRNFWGWILVAEIKKKLPIFNFTCCSSSLAWEALAFIDTSLWTTIVIASFTLILITERNALSISENCSNWGRFLRRSLWFAYSN